MNGQYISKRYVDSSDNLKCYNLQLKNTRQLIDAAMTCIPHCFVCCLEKKKKLGGFTTVKLKLTDNKLNLAKMSA